MASTPPGTRVDDPVGDGALGDVPGMSETTVAITATSIPAATVVHAMGFEIREDHLFLD